MKWAIVEGMYPNRWGVDTGRNAAYIPCTFTKAEAAILVEAKEMFELLVDLNEIMSTALHNGHEDLRQRTKEIVERIKYETAKD